MPPVKGSRMEITMSTSNNWKKKLIYCAALNYGIYLLMSLLFYSTYECQLDEMRQAAICGVSGTRSAYILYSHVLIGWILKGLASLMPTINWYFAYLSGLVIVALSIISYVIVKRTNNKIGWTVSAVLSCFIGYECYVLPGAMKTVSVLGIAMLLLLADYIETKNFKNRRQEGLIVLLAVLGSMVHFSAFLVTLLIGCVSMAGYYVIRNAKALRSIWKKERKADWNVIAYLAAFAVVVIAFIGVFRIVDCLSYRVSGREDAGKYRSAMIRMYGYGMGDYDNRFAEKYGIDSAEYSSIKKGSFGVTGESTWEKLDGLSRERGKLSGTAINSYFKTVPISLFKYGIFYLFVLMMFLILYSPIKEKKLLVWSEIVLLLLSFFVAYLFHACQNNWTVFIIILPLLLPLVLCLKGAEAKEYRYLWAYLAVLSVILYSKFSSGMVSGVSGEDVAKRFSELPAGGQVNLVDLNAYFKSFSAQRIYVKDLMSFQNLKTSNGAYALLEGFDDDVLNAYPSENRKYEWVYNAKEISVWDLVFED